MRILVIGDDLNFQECSQKFDGQHVYQHVKGHREAENFLQHHDLVFDFVISDAPAFIEMYTSCAAAVFLNTCTISLGQLAQAGGNKWQSSIFGFNGMPTLLNRSVLEVSVWKKEDEPALTQLCNALQTEYLLVDDRVGLVTPRVVCMIINEAYYTEMDGTASREDIDMAMKLGTNYPYGPFEWCARIGVRQVYKLLEAVYEDTKDERYKICPALKKEFLRT